MATIRDLVSALRQRAGVVAAIVLGRDGLLIDGATTDAFDADGLAAHVPPMALAAADLGRAAARGEMGLIVLEYSGGTAIVTALSSDALLLVVVDDAANLPSLLYDLRRHRTQIATLV